MLDVKAHGVAVSGQLEGRAVEVRLEVARALSMATDSCFPLAGKEERQVRVPLAAGGYETREEAVLPTLKLGAVELSGLRVAKTPEPGPCTVTLGMDLLVTQAFELDFALRQVAFVPSQPGAAYDRVAKPPLGTYVVEFAIDPTTDLLVVPVGLQGRAGAGTVAPFVLSLGLERSVLSKQLGRKLGFTEGEGAVMLENIELGPGLVLHSLPFELAAQWNRKGADGILGREVWAAAKVMLDIPARRMVAQGPRGEGEALPGTPKPARIPGEESEPGDPPRAR